MLAQPLEFINNTELSLLHRYQTCKAMSKGYAADFENDEARLVQARSYCVRVLRAYWASIAEKHRASMTIKPVASAVQLDDIAVDAGLLADRTGELIALFPAEDAGFLIGSIYTVMLPTAYRSEKGAYYTPPPLVERLLDMAENSGVDFSKASVIDPACGGGAFLAPVALRMLKNEKGSSPEWIFRRLVKRLKGIEIDPFAAWMSLVLLEAAIMPLCVSTKRRIPDSVVIVGDALVQDDLGEFDLVMGNPPYGRVSLNPVLREKFSRSLFGHANLYGLFTDLAVRLIKPDTGVIAFLTPTSFLGGQYFTSLRNLLTQYTTPYFFDFISDRDGVFDDVLQETMLATFKSGRHDRKVSVSSLIPKGLNKAKTEALGKVDLESGGKIWLLPRKKTDVTFINKIKKLTLRLSDVGYKVSTGQLVWNRFKPQLRQVKKKGYYPLIWAESVTPEGFKFSATRKNHVPFIEVMKKQDFLITTNECLLVQRTTSKEQDRRIMAAIIPQNFIDEYGGVVVENHVNVISSDDLFSGVHANVIEKILNSATVDRIFRCISGSVAVSAYELNAIPLPDLAKLTELQNYIGSGVNSSQLEGVIAKIYGVSVS
ncbi:HsdM family class I SAM-dependent methyltransferase [Type-D symbiont of Plautia stali]|uniref:HsdM family class I SAM-dependent methyltransferase n=1 Tax=Type-D symbiont of Plautia stali TaxID=1560356 RepID=UPI00073EEC31|nr:N-6 DNA methylase [Type-D symbiont of Plautia stali]